MLIRTRAQEFEKKSWYRKKGLLLSAIWSFFSRENKTVCCTLKINCIEAGDRFKLPISMFLLFKQNMKIINNVFEQPCSVNIARYFIILFFRHVCDGFSPQLTQYKSTDLNMNIFSKFIG